MRARASGPRRERFGIDRYNLTTNWLYFKPPAFAVRFRGRRYPFQRVFVPRVSMCTIGPKRGLGG